MPNLRQHINLLHYKPKIPFLKTPLSEYVNKLRAGTSFSFSRFGDGEWMALLGRTGANCDGHEYFPAMSALLRNAVSHPSGDYMFAIQYTAIKQLGRQIWNFLKKNRVTTTWHDSNVFHHANTAGELLPFIEALRGREVVLIGPDYLRAIDKRLVNYAHFIEIPSKNCFLSIEKIERDISEYAQNHTGVVFLFTASMAANCMIHDLFPKFGKKHTMMDIGSLWDAYLGLNTRSFCTAFDWAEILKKNTGT